MAESITYGTWEFPQPTPFVGLGVEPIYNEGKVDHVVHAIELIGNLTGENLSGLHVQKMDMITGLMPEFKTLTISNDTDTKNYSFTKPIGIEFSESDLTTVLPYSVTFTSFSTKSFSEFFGISNPVDTWSFAESDGRVTEATHTVSAKGEKVDANSALLNARNFVAARTTGFADISLFQTGVTGFLMRKTEKIDKKEGSYAITETYRYNTSDNPLTESGVVTANTQIAYNKEGELSVNVNASVQGSMLGAKEGTPWLLDTGAITAEQAKEVAVNAVASSLSDYESGVYTFIDRDPSDVSYTVDTGANKIDFSFNFKNPENLEQDGNILHKRSATINADKERSTVSVGVRGELKFNAPFEIAGTGDPATGARFAELDASYSGIADNSGFFNMAVEALQEFREDATGYHISGDYLNPVPLAENISKTPVDSMITYDVQFDNRIDLSSGTLSGLKVNITDKKPISITGVVTSLESFAVQELFSRTAGEYQVSASCEANTGDLQQLKDVISGHMTGIYTFSESSSVDDQTISYNTSRYY